MSVSDQVDSTASLPREAGASARLCALSEAPFSLPLSSSVLSPSSMPTSSFLSAMVCFCTSAGRSDEYLRVIVGVDSTTSTLPCPATCSSSILRLAKSGCLSADGTLLVGSSGAAGLVAGMLLPAWLATRCRLCTSYDVAKSPGDRYTGDPLRGSERPGCDESWVGDEGREGSREMPGLICDGHRWPKCAASQSPWSWPPDTDSLD
ncbi:hypothetical protein FBU31_003622 [Coemansia sp. 'formosensis']|nr:hypothetical protein FBU31_003622 [Coemansia sp. 'formosensis']